MEAVICFLCTNDVVKRNTEFYDVQSTFVAASRKPLQVVLQHLANCIKYKLIFQSETYICAECFKELCDYDKLMLNLLTSQRRLTGLLQNALLEKPDEEEAHKLEMDENEQSLDIELEFEDEGDDPNLQDAFDPNLDTKEELIEVEEDVIIEEQIVEDLTEEIQTTTTNELLIPEAISSSADHKRNHLQCIICGMVMKSKYLLQYHMGEVHNAKSQFTCKICGVTRKDEEYLELHMNIHDGKTENECRYCPKRFSRPVNTLRHMRIHWDKKKFQCEKCGERFSLDNMLYNHRLRHEAEENPLICGICNQSFRSRKTYAHHLLIHQENRPRHYCHLCPKSFTERYTLKMHLKTHCSEDKQDNTTSTIFENDKSSLNHLIETETEAEEEIGMLVENDSENSDGDYSCVICSKKYDVKDDLEQHLQDEHDVVLK